MLASKVKRVKWLSLNDLKIIQGWQAIRKENVRKVSHGMKFLWCTLFEICLVFNIILTVFENLRDKNIV